MTTYMKLVKGATKIKLAPPKLKYIEPILLGSADPNDFREIIRALEARISDSAWTIAYKSVIMVHLLIREGDKNVTLDYLSNDLDFFTLSSSISNNSTAETRYLTRYANYLKIRCQEFGKTNKDYVREGYSNLKLSTDPSPRDLQKALQHVESLEVQISSLLKLKYSQMDLNNELLLFSFKLLVQDLLALYNALNEGIITLLETFFELSHRNAEKTLDLYKTFVNLTEHVVKYLKSGKSIGMKIPVIKHITTKLIRSLEEHLLEDERTHNTFSQSSTSIGNGTPDATIDNNNNNNNSKASESSAQVRLDQIREQKRILQEQLNNQQVLISPVSPTSTTNTYNPFSIDSVTLDQSQSHIQAQIPIVQSQTQIAQATSNPFMFVPQQTTSTTAFQQTAPNVSSQGPQQQPAYQPQTSAPVPAPAHAQQQGLQHINTFSASNQNQIVQLHHPFQTYETTHAFPSAQQQIPDGYINSTYNQHTTGNIQNNNNVQPQTNNNNISLNGEKILHPQATGSKNPFSMDNITKNIEQREQINPFSTTNFEESDNNQFQPTQISSQINSQLPASSSSINNINNPFSVSSPQLQSHSMNLAQTTYDIQSQMPPQMQSHQLIQHTQTAPSIPIQQHGTGFMTNSNNNNNNNNNNVATIPQNNMTTDQPPQQQLPQQIQQLNTEYNPFGMQNQTAYQPQMQSQMQPQPQPQMQQYNQYANNFNQQQTPNLIDI
ncbi:Yap1801p NDAI_0C03280 [Naumovozyma dairenensis CBS 421]|uniref:ENTH domain-containing protein n=1 Tax=Naumovozyma dairenensis (strain ATCC 10597 / BCRC 20456 / CBS 421 / NBRC 0211 / NRRL Y-12639) TaxID=1071378 RepID=G0W877_NAUDC|nr:hypothetical protein NDAI_0C03280 [Naumovozyma dairenensis CBS 421]CCD23988.1 hypothetical protein NDAI_0C03280 [Naumovozyma dairenensis CBS 421]